MEKKVVIVKAYAALWWMMSAFMAYTTWGLVQFALGGWSSGTAPDYRGAVQIGIGGALLVILFAAAGVLIWKQLGRWWIITASTLLLIVSLLITDLDDFFSFHFQHRTLIGLPVLIIAISSMYLFGFSNDIRALFNAPEETKVK